MKKSSATTSWKNILVPIDFSPAAEKALRCAADLARHHDAKLILLHVVPQPETNGTVDSATRKLAEFRTDAGLLPAECRLVVRTGVPFFEIAQSAAAEQADLIVLGRCTAENGNGFDVGHTFDRVIRYATSAVLLVTDGATENNQRR